MFSDYGYDTENRSERTRRTDARLLRSWSCLGRIEVNIAVFWMRFRQVPCESDFDHLTLCGLPDAVTTHSSDWDDVFRSGYRLRLLYVFDNSEELQLEFRSLEHGPFVKWCAWLAISRNHHKDANVVACGVASFQHFGGGSPIPETNVCHHRNACGPRGLGHGQSEGPPTKACFAR